MKLISPLVSSTAHLMSLSDSICWIRACAAISSIVRRSRRRFRSIGWPSSTTMMGSPSSTGRRRGTLKLSTEVKTWSKASVPITRTAPVTE